MENGKLKLDPNRLLILEEKLETFDSINWKNRQDLEQAIREKRDLEEHKRAALRSSRSDTDQIRNFDESIAEAQERINKLNTDYVVRSESQAKVIKLRNACRDYLQKNKIPLPTEKRGMASGAGLGGDGRSRMPSAASR